MPGYREVPNISPPKSLNAEWKDFRKGLNLLLRPTELGNDEMAQADNIMLAGSGVPTGRWGSVNYFSANATGIVRGFGTFVDTASGINELLALTDQGYLIKQDTPTTAITGQSWPSGSSIEAEQLGGKTYIFSENVPMTVYDGVDLSVYATLSAPTGLAATNFSGVTGSYNYSWKVTTVSDTGETNPSTNVALNQLPQDLSDTEIHVFWTLATGTNVQGYQVYRGLPGDETLLAAVGPSVSKYVDRGEAPSEIVEPPLSNNTGGVESKYVAKFKDRLLAVDAKDPNKLLISGRYPNHDKFSWYYGGGYVYIDPDSGDDITGITVQPGTDRIVVYKNYSHYAVELSSVQIGNFLVLDPVYQPISTSVGASAHRTIQTVENDTFYFGRSGIYVTGYEPNFLNIIRTNEISARIRPYLSQLSEQDYRTANALYVDNKYLLSFPRRKEVVVYDRERGAFAGIWKLPWGIASMINYIDGDGNERWVQGSYNNNSVYYFNESAKTDNGSAINKTLRTNKEIFKDWSLFKTINLFSTLFRRVNGTVTVNLLVENRDGSTSVAKSFDLISSSTLGNIGWGINTWGEATWGESAGTVVVGSEETSTYSHLFKTARLIQVEVLTTQAGSNFELLGLNIIATPESGEFQSALRK